MQEDEPRYMTHRSLDAVSCYS